MDSSSPPLLPFTAMGHDPMRIPRFSGFPTFMRMPIAQELASLDIAVVGVPYDGGTTFRPGARHGPSGIRHMSTFLRRLHHATHIDPFTLCHIADVGDVHFSTFFEHVEVLRDIEAAYRVLHSAGVIPLTLGGDHSITYPIFKAIADEHPVGMVHIDAHTDTWDETMGSRFHHGSPFRRAVEDGLLDPTRTVQIGIRGSLWSSEANDFSLASGMRVIFMEEFTKVGVEAVIEEARHVVGDSRTYLSFDVDGLDPAFAPGTGTPEVGGITTGEAQCLIRGLRGLDLIGADVVEVAPPLDPSGVTSLVGATMAYEVLCVLAERIGAVRDH